MDSRNGIITGDKNTERRAKLLTKGDQRFAGVITNIVIGKYGRTRMEAQCRKHKQNKT